MSTEQHEPKQLVRSLDRLASLPGVYFEVKKLMDDPHSTTTQLGEVISKDPALTTRLLRVANSAYFGCPSHFDTVSHAATYLGFQHIHDLILSTAITNSFSHLSGDVMDMKLFWSGSIYTAVAAKAIARQINAGDLERVFIQGLLHDIGHLVMYSAIPELCQQAIVASHKQGKPLHVAEKNLIGCDYAEVGAALLEFWNLPRELQDVVNFHPYPERAQLEPLATAITHVAAILGKAVIYGQDHEDWFPALSEFALGETGMKLDSLLTIKEQCDKQVNDVIGLFLPGARLPPSRTRPWAVPAA